jgi:hypothetical protein
MNLLQKLFAGIGLSAIVLAPVAAIAQSAGSFSSVHKWTDSASSKTYVYVPGQTAGNAVTGFTAPKAPVARSLTLNNCGWGSFTKSATSPPTNITGGSTNWAGKSSGSPVTCSAGASSSTYTASNNGPIGTVIDDGTKIWIKGGTGPGTLSINVTSGGNITTKANDCGFVRVTVSESRPMTNFSIGSMNYTLAALPAVNKPMICRKLGTSSFTYLPAN